MLHTFLDGRDISRTAPGLGSARDGAGGMNFLRPKIVERVLVDASTKLRADVEVFQTSVPRRHGWMLETGDLNILRQGSVKDGLEPSADGGAEATTPVDRRG